jgi:hypothetical protein
MPYVVAAAAVAAGATVYASSQQSSAIKSAQNSANAAQTSEEATLRADLAPYSGQGQAALGVVGDLSGANGVDAAKVAQGNFVQSPGYQFQFDQGLRAVDAGAAAKGLTRSGATIKGEESFGQGLASQDFNTYYNNLFNLANMGESAAAKTGAGAITTGQGIAQTDTSAGLAQANIIGNEFSSLSKTSNSVFSNPQTSSSLNSLFSSSGNTAGGGFIDSGSF